jgi:hypothetical protein
MKEYIYFVSYAHGKDGYFGFGSAEVPMYEYISSRQDILAIGEVLCYKDKTLFNPMILFFKLLRVVEAQR